LVRDLLRVSKAKLAHVPKIDAVDDQLPVVTTQDVITLAANEQKLDGLAFALQPLDVLTRQTRDVGVETAAQTALGSHYDKEVHLIPAGADQQRGQSFAARDALVEVGENAIHALCIGTRSGRGFLRAAQL